MKTLDEMLAEIKAEFDAAMARANQALIGNRMTRSFIDVRHELWELRNEHEGWAKYCSEWGVDGFDPYKMRDEFAAVTNGQSAWAVLDARRFSKGVF